MTEQTNAQDDILVWIQSAIRGDQTAYANLYEHFSAGIYRLCYGLVLNKQDAEDVLQESFVYAFKNLSRYDANKASFKTWLYTIAVSRCRNTYRRKRFLTVDFSQILQLQLAGPNSDTPEAVIAQRESIDAIQSALVELTPNLREAIILRYGHGLTYREIADIMDCPQKTAESRVRLAHGKLKEVLRPVGRGLLEDLLQI
ncbi:MAG: sigma-70 family RNA polymerase sigma factor [Phototrophicaceae bacterium]